MGLERAGASPYERPIEASAGLSSEEIKWTPDGRFVVGGALILLHLARSEADSLYVPLESQAQ